MKKAKQKELKRENAELKRLLFQKEKEQSNNQIQNRNAEIQNKLILLSILVSIILYLLEKYF